MERAHIRAGSAETRYRRPHNMRDSRPELYEQVDAILKKVSKQ